MNISTEVYMKHSLITALINDWNNHNNITPFEHIIKKYKSIGDSFPIPKTEEAIYYRNVFLFILNNLSKNIKFFSYNNPNPPKNTNILECQDKPVIVWDDDFYLYSLSKKQYVKVKNYSKKQLNVPSMIAAFQYKDSENKYPFITDVSMKSIQKLVIGDFKYKSFPNLNLLVFYNETSSQDTPTATFFNSLDTKYNFYFVGYDFKKKKPLPHPQLDSNTLRMLTILNKKGI